MEEIKANVLKKALGMLDVLGCQYAVLDPEGVKHGTLEVVTPKQRKKKVLTGMSYQQFYKPILLKSEGPSDTIFELSPPEGADLEFFRASVCGWCSKNWGKETYSSQVKDGKVLIMRYS